MAARLYHPICPPYVRAAPGSRVVTRLGILTTQRLRKILVGSKRGTSEPAGPRPQYCVTPANLSETGLSIDTMPSGARAPRTFYPTSLLRIQQKSSGPLTRSGSRAPRTSLRFLPCVCAGQRAGSSKRCNDKTHLFNTEIVGTCTRENCNLSPERSPRVRVEVERSVQEPPQGHQLLRLREARRPQITVCCGPACACALGAFEGSAAT